MVTYSEICKYKLINYTEEQFRVETWQSNTHEFKCIWMSQNNLRLPSTITYTKLNGNP